MSGHYCYLEARYFPRDQFEYSAKWGWVHVTSEPHTDLGTPVNPSASAIDGPGAIFAPAAEEAEAEAD